MEKAISLENLQQFKQKCDETYAKKGEGGGSGGLKIFDFVLSAEELQQFSESLMQGQKYTFIRQGLVIPNDIDLVCVKFNLLGSNVDLYLDKISLQQIEETNEILFYRIFENEPLSQSIESAFYISVLFDGTDTTFESNVIVETGSVSVSNIKQITINDSDREKLFNDESEVRITIQETEEDFYKYDTIILKGNNSARNIVPLLVLTKQTDSQSSYGGLWLGGNYKASVNGTELIINVNYASSGGTKLFLHTFTMDDEKAFCIVMSSSKTYTTFLQLVRDQETFISYVWANIGGKNQAFIGFSAELPSFAFITYDGVSNSLVKNDYDMMSSTFTDSVKEIPNL